MSHPIILGCRQIFVNGYLIKTWLFVGNDAMDSLSVLLCVFCSFGLEQFLICGIEFGGIWIHWAVQVWVNQHAVNHSDNCFNSLSWQPFIFSKYSLAYLLGCKIYIRMIDCRFEFELRELVWVRIWEFYWNLEYSALIPCIFRPSNGNNPLPGIILLGHCDTFWRILHCFFKLYFQSIHFCSNCALGFNLWKLILDLLILF